MACLPGSSIVSDLARPVMKCSRSGLIMRPCWATIASLDFFDHAAAVALPPKRVGDSASSARRSLMGTCIRLELVNDHLVD